ncbi:HTH-type transcriptional regulator CymR [Oxobacter pfennigii]|uniref:HTH-type transcriptional regulator CymR n=1 Tax=Oxobacter pfennigii TaxID=36849 RepID=A0A0P9ALC8_9CLOT|nr:Rrf2 family transcriptional regulator [Oxobacter pfennigii]KPU46177.1 HTH-type transcriptional regulator CymR [Oxobacter pfennigii]
MRISVKGRYAIIALINMAQLYNNGEYITIISISERLGISKIYLEQVFSLLKRGGLVNSVKGAQGGYQLSRVPQEITVYDILTAVELTLFERTEETVSPGFPEIETALRRSVFDPLDDAVKTALQGITLYDLADEIEKYRTDQGYMFFI